MSTDTRLHAAASRALATLTRIVRDTDYAGADTCTTVAELESALAGRPEGDLLAPAQWSTVHGLVRWLDSRNGRDDHEVTLRIMKLSEEVGEVMQARIGSLGQNPRKGITHTTGDVAEELVDAIVTAVVALASITNEPEAVLGRKLAAIAQRAEAVQ